jgi:hypothetical protein
VLGGLPQVASVTRVDDYLSVKFSEGRGADGLIARALVGAGLDVTAIVPEEVNLDEAFLEITRGTVQ